MTNEELKQITKHREKRTLEYKEAWSELPSNLFETVCAFLNRDGGVIVLGAHDDGTIVEGVNLHASEQMCKNLANMSNNSEILKPTFLLQPEIVDIDETKDAEKKQVIVIQVPSSSQVHSCKGRVFDRSVDGDFQLRTDAEISAAYLRKSNQYTENTIYPFLRIEHFKSDLIEKTRNLIRNNRSDHPWLSLNDMDFFRQANLYRYDINNNQEGFTLAALMLFGKDEIIQSALPYYKIDAIVRLNDTERYDDRLSIDGNIIDAYEQLLGFLAKHLPDSFFMENGQRVSLRDKLFREIVANMLIHREYLNPTPTTLTIGEKGIVVQNANRPLRTGPVTLQNYERHPKNPHMANFYVQLGRAEHLGTGIRNIYRYAPLYANADPIINDEDVYKVVIALPSELVNVTRQKSIQRNIQKKLQEKDIKLTEIQLKVVMAIVDNPSITRALLCQKIGLSEATITTCISALKKKKVIFRKGGKRYGEWVLLV